MTEQNNTKTQGILFDLDGTLWYSSPASLPDIIIYITGLICVRNQFFP